MMHHYHNFTETAQALSPHSPAFCKQRVTRRQGLLFDREIRGHSMARTQAPTGSSARLAATASSRAAMRAKEGS